MYLSEFQAKARAWMRDCFGPTAYQDREKRAKRFMEEALELVQACDLPKESVLKIVDYVYSRQVGGRVDEMGGTMLTLSCLASSYGIDQSLAAEHILGSVWNRIERIREKDAAKPTFDATESPAPLAGE